MNVKDMIVRVNDYICYILLAIVCIGSMLVGAVNPIYGAVFGVVGLVLFAFITGYWFVLSTIADNAQKTNILLEKQNALISKIYKQGQHNIEIQFPNE